MLVCIIGLKFPSQKQDLLRSSAPFLGSRLYSTLHGFDHQRPFLPVAHIDPGPSIFGELRAPIVYSYERIFGMPTATQVRWGQRVEVTNQCVRGDPQEISFSALPQFEPETTGTPHLVITRDPSVRQFLSAFLQHLQRQFMTSVKLGLLGNAGLLPTGAVLCPIFRKIKTCINECMFLMRDVSHIDTDLAVLDLAETSAPLPGDAHRLISFFGKC